MTIDIRSLKWGDLEKWYQANKHEFIQQYRGGNGKTYGYLLPLDDEKVYVTERFSNHFYVKRQAFLISSFIFKDLKARDCSKILIRYHTQDENRILWLCSDFYKWDYYGFPHKDEQTGESQWGLQDRLMARIEERKGLMKYVEGGIA